MSKLVSVTADLSAIPLSSFPIDIGKNGKEYYKINYKIVACFLNNDTKFQFHYRGKEWGMGRAGPL